MEGETRKILVAGGGITGLSTAFYLAKIAREQGWDCEITVAEANERFGGKINTLRRDGFVIEKGPDSFLSRKTPIIDLTQELGLEGELEGQNPQSKKTYILRRGRLHPMPGGLVLGIPTQLKPFISTRLLSLPGKLRAGLDWVLPRREGEADESLGGFLTRRLGREVLTGIAEPLLAGIYAGDTHSLSLLATFPQFREAERAHGSLIRGTLAGRKQTEAAAKAAVAKAAAGVGAAAEAGAVGAGATSVAGGAVVSEARRAGVSSGAKTDGAGANPMEPAASDSASNLATDPVAKLVRSSMFLTYRGGLATLVEALLAALEREGVRMRSGRGLKAINRMGGAVTGGRVGMTDVDGHGDRDHQGELGDGSGQEGGYEASFDDGGTERFDAVVLSLPTFSIARLLDTVPAVKALADIPYVSVANVILAFSAADVTDRLDGSGFLVPRTEGKFITACTWTSSKWLHTAPPDKLLLRCYIGRSGAEDWLAMSDDELVARVRADLKGMLGLEAVPLFHEITRLPKSMPQYPVGHLDRVRAAREQLAAAMPGVAIAGAGFHGVGLPDCIRQGKEAAQAIGDFLQHGM
jgi:oxygen-dependent protoporphyrinogen oxidase